MSTDQAIKTIDAEIKRQEQELQRLREGLAAIETSGSLPNDQYLMDAVLNCPHSITHDAITLHFYPKQKAGHNALAQLRHRLAAADAAAKAREMELLAVIEDLERLIPLINRGGTP